MGVVDGGLSLPVAEPGAAGRRAVAEQALGPRLRLPPRREEQQQELGPGALQGEDQGEEELRGKQNKALKRLPRW